VAWEKEDLSLEEVVDEGGDKEGQENEVAQQVEGDEVNLPEKKPVSTLNGESTDCVGPRRDTSILNSESMSYTKARYIYPRL